MSKLKMRYIMVVLLFAVGCGVSVAVNKRVTEISRRYSEAVRVDDIGHYDNYLLNGVGDAIVYGQVSTGVGVSFSELNQVTEQSFISIKKNCEHLLEDIDVDAEGNIEFDYDWEDCNRCSEERKADKVQFMGHEYKAEMIRFPMYKLNLKEIGVETKKSNSAYIYQSGRHFCGLDYCLDTRYSYKYTPNNLSGSILVNISDGELKFVSEFYGDKSIDMVIAEKQSAIKFWSWMIWVIWIPLSLLLIALAEFCISKLFKDRTVKNKRQYITLKKR